MKQIERARFNAYTLSLAHLADNSSITKDVSAFEQTCLEAKNLLEAIEAANNRRTEKIAEITSKLKVLREELVRNALTVSSNLSGYASAIQDALLKESITFSYSELQNVNDSRLNEYSNYILAKARELGTLAQSHGITEAMLKELQRSIDDFKDTKYGSRNLLTERKRKHNRVTELMKQANCIFVERLDTMMQYFENIYPDFYDAYLSRRAIVNPGHRSTRIAGLVKAKATQAELGKVKITVPSTGVATLTSKDGSYVIKSPIQATVQVVYECEGYKTVTTEVAVKRGQATILDIEMEAA